MANAETFGSGKKTVKSASLYVNGGEWYLDITYVIETDYQVREIRIPKVRLPIEHALIIEVPNRGLVVPADMFLYVPGEGELRICETNQKQLYTERIISEKRKEMTLEDIEAKLGYKVKIVSEHSVNDTEQEEHIK